MSWALGGGQEERVASLVCAASTGTKHTQVMEFDRSGLRTVTQQRGERSPGIKKRLPSSRVSDCIGRLASPSVASEKLHSYTVYGTSPAPLHRNRSPKKPNALRNSLRRGDTVLVSEMHATFTEPLDVVQFSDELRQVGAAEELLLHWDI